MATTEESGFDGDGCICNQNVVVVTFPAILGRFDESIQFGTKGLYERSLCKNPGDVKKVVEAESICDDEVIRDEVQDVKNDEVEDMHYLEDILNIENEPKCEIAYDDLHPRDVNKVEEAESICDDEVIRDEKIDEVEDMHYLEDISNTETEPKCEITFNDDDNITVQRDEEIDDAESVGIQVIDEETEEEKKLNEQITNAEMELDKKTRSRDLIKAEIQNEKAKLKADNEALIAANMEIKTAERLVTSKRLEIDYCQSVVFRIKNAISVEDINCKINEVDRKKQYETLWLKDENQFLRAIKQLKSMCDRLASNMGSQDEIHLALIQKDNLDELLKNLKKEMKSLKDNVTKAEVAAKAIRKAYEEKQQKGKELQAKFRAASELRQKAYGHLSSLRKLLYNKDISVSAVSEVETEKTVSFLEEKLSGDQNAEKVESVKPTEVAENKVDEEIAAIFVEVVNEATEMEKQNALIDQNQAEMQVQNEVEQKEKACLERLLNKEKKLTSSVTSSSNYIDLQDVLELNESKEIEKPHQRLLPHFMPKQLKQNTISRAALGISNRNWLQRHWRKMVNAIVIFILAVVFYMRNIFV